MTNAAVLVLNRHFQPIHVTNAKRAFTLLYLGVARVIDQQFRTFDFESWAQLSDEIGSNAAALPARMSSTPSTGPSWCRA